MLSESGSDRVWRRCIRCFPRLRDRRRTRRLFLELHGAFISAGVSGVRLLSFAPMPTMFLQVPADALTRHGAADESRQPAAVQAVQQPRLVCACTIV